MGTAARWAWLYLIGALVVFGIGLLLWSATQHRTYAWIAFVVGGLMAVLWLIGFLGGRRTKPVPPQG